MNFRKVIPDLRDDESIFVFARSYSVAFLPWIITGIGLVLVGIILSIIAYFSFPEIRAGGLAYNIFIIMTSAYLLLMIPFLTVAFIDFYYDIHIVTDRRLIDIDQHSLFMRETNTLGLEEVQDVTVTQKGVFGSMFNFGMVIIETAAAQQNFEFDNVRAPNEIAGIIHDLANQCKERMERGTTEPAQPGGSIKGCINGKVYTSMEPLMKMGAVVAPGTPRVDAAPPSGRDANTIPADDLIRPEEPETQPSNNIPQPKEAPQEAGAADSDDKLDIVIDDPKNRPQKA